MGLQLEDKHKIKCQEMFLQAGESEYNDLMIIFICSILLH